MAKVGTQRAPGSLTSSSLQIGLAARNAVGPMVKRKTPSELRGEQLKRTNAVEISDESPAPLCGSMNNTSDNGTKKLDLPKNPRYIETRMDEVYPAKKSRLRVLSAKENTKENILTEQTNSKKNISVLSNIAAKRRISCSENATASCKVSEESKAEAHPPTESCSQIKFRGVAELSSNGERLSSSTVVDMDKALKGLVSRKVPASSGLAAETSNEHGSPTPCSAAFLTECVLPGQKSPLDFTLKTKMLVSSSCTVNRIHRSVTSSMYIGMPHSTTSVGCPKDCTSSEQALTSQVLDSKSLHSWVYPQSTLPPSVISVLSSPAVDGDFLRKRHQGWDASFRSLYYMLRKNMCNIFYVCTSHFVVMFISSCTGGTKLSCNAYISQSTRGLRSLLKEHDVSFSMPLCFSKVEEATTEDLVELSEIEKHNLGQTRRRASLSDIDSSPQSLLAFCGNKNVHALYDFLLNYRSSLTFLSGVDVPLLCAPVPFQNAALSAPEIRCVETKRVDDADANSRDSKHNDVESVDFRSSIEITGAYIPSWIISRVCALMGSEGKSFEARFVTERTSIGLNVALKTLAEKLNSKEISSKNLQEIGFGDGFPETAVSSCLDSGFLKGLKFSDGSYTASLSPL